MKRVRALRRGYDGRKIREAGEEFPFAGELGSWMEESREGEAKHPHAGHSKATTNASSVDEKPIHKSAKPETGKHSA